MQRLDRFLSEAGVASRRELRAIIRAGRVRVNDVPASAPEQKIDETSDRVTLDGEAVGPRGPVVLLLHKPTGYVTSTDDPRDRTVMEPAAAAVPRPCTRRAAGQGYVRPAASDGRRTAGAPAHLAAPCGLENL